MFEVKMTRRIPASIDTVYRAWTDPKQMIQWMGGVKLILHAEVDGLWFWQIRNHPHYGRILALEPSKRVHMTWMSESTRGLESKLEITFAEKEGATEIVLHHTGLPDDDGGRGHEAGWNGLLNVLVEKIPR
jgi:uncharacterized protein YndB with AHSA1/START domain